MRTLLPLILFCFHIHILAAQPNPQLTRKPLLDTIQLLTWPSIAGSPYPIISNNGEYLLYNIWNIPGGSNTMVARSLRKDRETSIVGAVQADFTNDSRHAIFGTPGDSLCILTLDNERREYVPNVTSYTLSIHMGREMLVYQRNDSERELVLNDLVSGSKYVYRNISSHIISTNGRAMLLKTVPDPASNIKLLLIDLVTKEQQTVWKGGKVSSLCLNASGEQVAFLVPDSATNDNALWLYQSAQKTAVELLKPGSTDLPGTMKIAAIEKFASDGRKLFVRIGERSSPALKTTGKSITIWSYTDPKLQTKQKEENRNGLPLYLAFLNIQSPGHIWRIQAKNETVSAKNDNDLVVLTSRKGGSPERYWNSAAVCTTYLALLNEERKIPVALSQATFSPGKKYLLGRGMTEASGTDLYAYELATNTIRNITKSIPATTKKEERNKVTTNQGIVAAAWLPGDNYLLIYDDYDIWLVDPLNKKRPRNLTNGRDKKLRFRLAEKESPSSGKVVRLEQRVFLTAFNTQTKEHGFYQLKWGTGQQPELLFMGDCFFSAIGVFDNHFIKARDTGIYLVRKEQAGQAPNIFSTTDFRNFSPITNLYPEKAVNWITSGLVTFKTLAGTKTQAILYKPENFNPTNKYPLLIHYYKERSEELNRYPPPQGWGTGADLDIAWFTSHGYLVLVPDIQTASGKPGESAYESILGAANYVAQLPYVDKDHIGIQGHSFGGYETSYLVSHSDLFAAAVSSAGVSEVTSSHGSLWGDGSSKEEYVERRGYEMGQTPWQAPAGYTNNSPIFSIGRINTPLLIIHNKADRNVPFEQGVGLFTALRRAGKRAWLLQYDNGGHGQGGDVYKDYIIRTMQFFDHYLKGAPAPVWMTRGVPAAMKGIDDGLSADRDIETPRNSHLFRSQEPTQPLLRR